MRGYDYEVVGDKIAEMVGDFYEHELEIRDAEIKRLRQQNAELLSALKTIDRYNDSPVNYDSYINKIVEAAIAKATGD